jgi:hypothetical protein
VRGRVAEPAARLAFSVWHRSDAARNEVSGKLR